jgi:pentatricopeptide repeat protein
MAVYEKRRKHGALFLSILWLSQSEGFQSSRPPTIPWRKARTMSQQSSGDHDPWIKMTKRKMVSHSADVPPTRSLNLRDIEQQIVTLGRLGNTDEALSIYQQVEQPTIRLMNTAIDACSRAKPTRLEEAFEIFKNGVETHGLKPNVFTFGVLMNACNRDRNVTKALGLLKTMKVSFPRRSL